MNSPWGVLGIEPGSDRKAVRRAYSKLVKCTRPDDDPVAFQRLHEAYQLALAFADETQNVGPVGVGEWSSDINAAAPLDDSRVISTVAEEPEPAPTLNSEQRARLETMLSRAQAVLDDELYRHAPTRWSFLTETPDLLNEMFREALGRGVLNMILDLELDLKVSGNPSKQVPGRVLALLDNVFFWSSHPETYADLKSDDHVYALNELLYRVDPSMHKTTDGTRPMGGELVTNYKPPAERDPAIRSSGADPLGVVWTLLRILLVLLFFGYTMWPD